MSVFFCDSNCELWHTRVEELGIRVIGMPYTIDDVTKDYDMGKETNFEEYFNKIKSGSLPTTQALNPYDYVQYFEPVLKAGEDIIYVHFSHELSGTFNYMKTAIEELKEKYPDRKITTVDTLSICVGEGLMVYEAAKMHKNGASDEEIVDFIKKNRQKFAMYFMVDDLMHLKRGGRISGATAFFGSMLGIKPILKIDENGKIVNSAKAKGRKKAIMDIFEKMKEIGENVADYPICVMDACNKEDADFLEQLVREYVGEDAVIWRQPIGPTIGAHCGPGTVGLVFHSRVR